MRKHRRTNVTEALQEVPGEGAEQASPIAEVSTDASEEENAGTEMLQYKVDDVIEVVQEAKGAEQAGRMLQKWSDNLDAIIQSSSVLAEVNPEHLARMGEFHSRAHGAELVGSRACYAAAPPRTSPQSRANFCVTIWRASLSTPAGSPRRRSR